MIYTIQIASALIVCGWLAAVMVTAGHHQLTEASPATLRWLIISACVVMALLVFTIGLTSLH